MLMVFEICLTWFLNQVKKNFFFCLISFLFLITLWSKLYVNIIFGSRVLTNFIRQLTRKMEIAQNDNWILIMIWKRGCMFRLLPVRLFVTFCIFYITSSAWILNWSFFLKKPVMFSESLGGFIGSTFIGGRRGGCVWVQVSKTLILMFSVLKLKTFWNVSNVLLGYFFSLSWLQYCTDSVLRAGMGDGEGVKKVLSSRIFINSGAF